MGTLKFQIGTLLLLCMLLPLINAQLIYQEGTQVQLKIPCINNGSLCSGSATCNLTVLYPNSSTLINNSAMNNALGFFTYDLSTAKTTPTGEYFATSNCNDGSLNGYSTFTYFITVNGKEPPEGITIIIFVILFLILLGMITGLILYTVGKFAEQEFNLWDLIYNISTFFVILGVYFFGKEYLSNAFFNTFLVSVISITSFTNVFFPLIAFIFSITVWKWKELDQW